MATTTGHILMGASKDGSFGFSIEWKFDCFSPHRFNPPFHNSSRLHSPRISLGGIPGEWNMWLDWVTCGEQNDYAFSIYLRYSPPPKGAVNVLKPPVGCIYLFASERFVSLGNRSFQKTTSDNVWNYISVFCKHHCKGKDASVSSFSKFSISVDVKLQEDSLPAPAIPDDMNMSELVGDPDVILMGNDEVEVTAHRRVLSLKSPVFAAMFEQDMLEKKTGQVTMPDFSSDLIREMLHHVYTGKEPGQLGQMASSLLQAADKYDLQDLKETCEVHLARQLDKSNCQETLDQANTFNCSYLKRKCMEWTSVHI